MRLRLLLARCGERPTLSDLAHLRDPFHEVASALRGTLGALCVWRVWIEAAIAAADSTSQPQVVLAVWRRAEAALRAESAPLKVLVAEWLCRLNLSRARELRPALLRSPPTPLRVHEALLAHETAEGPLYGKSVLQGASADLAGQSGGVSARCVAAELVALFERAVSEHGDDSVDLWLHYARCHLRQGAFAKASAVHDRALRVLKEQLHSDFVTRYQEALRGDAE